MLVGLIDAARVVTFENVGTSPTTVEPADLVLTVSSMSGDGSGPTQEPYATAGVDEQNASTDGSRVLAPGERATVQVSIAPIDESAVDCDGLPWVALEYHHPDAEPAMLSSQPVERCLEETIQAPASAGRPLLRLSR